MTDHKPRYPRPPRQLQDMGRPPMLRMLKNLMLGLLVLSIVVAVAGHLFVAELWRNVRFPEVPAERLVTVEAETSDPFSSEMPLGIEVVYGVAYQFEVAGQKYRGLGFSAAPVSLKAGDRIEVEFDRQDPNVNAAVAYRADPMPVTRMTLMILLAVLPGLALVLSIWHQRRWQRALWLIQRGAEATGAVKKVRRRGGLASGGAPAFRNTYAYTDGAGREHSGVFPARAGVSELYGNEGARVTVFYDPAKPSRFIPYEPLVDLPPLPNEEAS